MPKEKHFREMTLQVVAAMVAGLGIGLILYCMNIVSISIVFDLAVLAAIWDILCQLKQRDTASKKVGQEIWLGLCFLVIFVWLRMWFGWLLDFPINGVPNMVGGRLVDGVRESDVMLEIFFLMPGIVLAWKTIHSERMRTFFVKMAFVAFIAVFVSYRVPSVPEAIKAMGQNLNHITNSVSTAGLAGSTEEITLAKDIDVIYVPVENKVIPLLDVYDGSKPDDAADLLKITPHFKAGQKLLKLAGARVVDNTKLCKVQIPGTDGKFIGGRVLLVDAADIVVKDDGIEKTKSASAGSTVGSFLGSIGGGKKAEAATSERPAKRQPQKVTISFEGHKADEEIDTGLLAKKGDIVKYSGATAPYKVSGGFEATGNFTGIAQADNRPIRVSGTKGEVTVEVIASSK